MSSGYMYITVMNLKRSWMIEGFLTRKGDLLSYNFLNYNSAKMMIGMYIHLRSILGSFLDIGV